MVILKVNHKSYPYYPKIGAKYVGLNKNLKNI